MKIAIQKQVLVDALNRGAMAALSDEAQADTGPLKLLVQSVTIKVNKDQLTIKSTTKSLTTFYAIPIDKSINVKEEGVIVVPAKDLYDWCSKQRSPLLALSLTKLAAPEVINPMTAEAEGAKVISIKKIGTVNIVSQDESSKGNKWSMDCYESDQMKEAELNVPAAKQFSIPSAQLNDGISKIAFASMTKHYQHIYDSISFQKLNKKLYMVTCDTARLSLYEATDAKDINLETNLMVNVKMMSEIAKLTTEGDVDFFYDDASNKIYITQGDKFIIKVFTADKGLNAKFPPVSLLVDKKYIAICEAEKEKLMDRLVSAAMANEMSALFKFAKNELVINAISSSGKPPSKGNLDAKNLAFTLEAVWGVNHILDFLRVLKDETVELMVNDKYEENWSKKSLKMTSKQDSNWSYFIMPQDPKKSKYDDSKE